LLDGLLMLLGEVPITAETSKLSLLGLLFVLLFPQMRIFSPLLKPYAMVSSA